MQRIFITGCAHSGTTLMLRLFYAFRDVHVIDTEVSPEYVADVNIEKPVVVGKSPGPCLGRALSKNRMSWIIYMLRDGRDLIEDWADPGAWMQNMEEYKTFKEDPNACGPIYPLRYEWLVSHPDIIQKRLAKNLGLRADHPFSSYPDFVPKRVFELPSHDPSPYRPRPITRERIDKRWTIYPMLAGQQKARFDGYLELIGCLHRGEKNGP
jgi:hypothetical protein